MFVINYNIGDGYRDTMMCHSMDHFFKGRMHDFFLLHIIEIYFIVAQYVPKIEAPSAVWTE